MNASIPSKRKTIRMIDNYQTKKGSINPPSCKSTLCQCNFNHHCAKPLRIRNKFLFLGLNNTSDVGQPSKSRKKNKYKAGKHDVSSFASYCECISTEDNEVFASSHSYQKNEILHVDQQPNSFCCAVFNFVRSNDKQSSCSKIIGDILRGCY